MRICIVGNSHIAALKLAINKGLYTNPDIEITFFGAPQKQFKEIRLKKGLLCGPKDIEEVLLEVSGGKYSAINPQDFDVIVFHGVGMQLHLLVESIYRCVSDSKITYSVDFLEQGVEDLLTSGRVFKIAKRILVSGDSRVVLSPRPAPSEFAGWNKEGNMPENFRKSIWDLFSSAARNNGFDVILQPEETMASTQLTQQKYSANSTKLVNLDVEHRSDENHMNQTYGSLVLKALIDMLSETR